MQTPTSASGNRVASILHPAEGQLRAKTIVSRSNASPSGKYPSWKMGRMMQWGKSSELNAFRLLDAEPRVLAFREYPLTVQLICNDQALKHYPEIQVDLSSGRELWRVCTAEQAASPEEAALTSLLKAQLPSYGYTYRIVTAESLALEPRLSIALSLLRYGRKTITLTEREHLQRVLEKTGYIHWGTADVGALGPRSRTIIARLTLEGVLSVSYDAALTPQTAFIANRQ